VCAFFAAVVQNNLNNIQTVVTPLFGFTNKFMDIAYCGFVGVAYFQIKNAVCNTMMYAHARA
jgi:hypothetical protein